MDNITHSLVGALIGQAGLKRRTGLAMPALIIGANIPDVDAACLFWLDGVQHLAFRRGTTHGPIAWMVLPLLLAGMLYGFDRWQASRGTRPAGRLPMRFGWLFGLSLLACLTHPALDWLNVYGVRLLEPFSHRWFYGDTLFIIDVWLWLGMGFATWFSLRQETRGGEWKRPAQIAVVASLAYIAINGSISWYAQRFMGTMREPYPREVITSPPLIAFWRRERIAHLADGRWVSTNWDGHAVGQGYHARRQPLCRTQGLEALRATNADLDAFLFWSRAPFAERAPDGSVAVRDARYLDPRAGDRFSVRLPGVQCVPLPTG